MTEFEFYAQTVRENLIDADAVRARIVQTPVTKRRVRPMLIVVACIPEARREVLSWFRSMSVSDYLGTPADEREDLPDMDALLVPQPTSAATVTEPATLGAIEQLPKSEKAKAIAQLLRERFSVTLGETLYDGETLYLSMTLGNGFGVRLLEGWVGGEQTTVAIPPELTSGFFDDGGAPEEYRTGAVTLYSFTEGTVVLTLPNGRHLVADVIPANNESFAAFQKACRERPADAAALVETYLAEQPVMAVAMAEVAASELALFLDADGLLTLPATLRLVIEEISSRNGPSTVLMEADLGEITFNAVQYSEFETVQHGVGDPVTLSGDYSDVVQDDTHVLAAEDPYRVYTGQTVSLDGVQLQVTGVERTATGIADIMLEMRFPKTASESDVQAYLSGMTMLTFRITVPGMDAPVYSGIHQEKTSDSRCIILRTGKVQEVPLALMEQADSVTLVPELGYCVGYCKKTADGGWGESVPFEDGVPVVFPTDTTGEYYLPYEIASFSDCAMTVELP